MRWSLLSCLVACGGGGSGDDGPDAPAMCADPTSVASCGAACAPCSPADDRSMPTCDGVACGVACVGNAPKCNDGSCTRLVFDFSSNTLEGAASADAQLGVRSRAGNPALAIDVTNLTQVSFHVPICASGSVDFTQRTLSATVFFEGPPSSGDQFFVQASAPVAQNGAFLGTISAPANTATTFSAPFSMSQLASAINDVTFQAGTLGIQFTGTIWFDDITVR